MTAKRKIAKSAVTGKIVSNAEAKANPATTFVQTTKAAGDSARIDAIVRVLRANGISLPKELE